MMTKMMTTYRIYPRHDLMVVVESSFRDGTNSRLVRLPSKERRQQALAWHVDVCTSTTNNCVSPFLTLLVSSPASSSITSSTSTMHDKKRRAGRLLQQQPIRQPKIGKSVNKWWRSWQKL